MYLPILAVDKDIEASLKEQAVWKQHGISTVRTDTMQEAIEKLSREDFLFTAINADTITYLPMLKIMRETTQSPIFIITSDFKIEDEVEALLNGADGYTPFQVNTEKHILSALALLQRHHEHDKQPIKPRIIVYDKIFVLPDLRQIFCNDIEIVLTKKEFDIFNYLLDNRGCVLSFNQIYHKVWENGYDDAEHTVLWSHMVNLRKKISSATGSNGYIENVREVGYRLPIKQNKQETA